MGVWGVAEGGGLSSAAQDRYICMHEAVHRILIGLGPIPRDYLSSGRVDKTVEISTVAEGVVPPERRDPRQ